MKSLFHSLLLVLCLLLMIACEEEPQLIKVTGISITPQTLSLTEGETGKLTATISPKDAANQAVIWDSDNKTVVIVENGIVTALSAGTAKVTATSSDGGFSSSSSITVVNKIIEVTSITLSKAELNLTEGESETITAIVKPDDATDKTISWSSSNPSIATVEAGKITAVQEGSATISATAGDKSASCAVVVAKRDTLNDPIAFTDANFKAYCISNYDQNNDGEISYNEALSVTKIDICTDNIESIDEIIYFKNITHLFAKGSSGCYRSSEGSWEGELPEDPYFEPGTSVATGKLTKVILTGLTKLTELDISYNNTVLSIDISDNIALRYFYCGMCNIKNLDISNNTSLRELQIWYNQLSSIDISHNTSLTLLYCDYNPITKLDLSNNPNISTLQCSNLLLTELDVSYVTNLQSLCFNFNQLTSIDVSNNSMLQSLSCWANKLTQLDLSHNPELLRLDCQRNQLSSLDLVANTKLSYLCCSQNQISHLEVSNNKELTYLVCSNNSLNSIDVSNNYKLSTLGCEGNQITSLDVCNNSELLSLHCGNNKFSQLDVAKNKKLKSLWCGSNFIEAIDLHNNPELVSLHCENTLLKSIDVSANMELSDLWCNDNPYLKEIWLKKGQEIKNFHYDSDIATIKYIE